MNKGKYKIMHLARDKAGEEVSNLTQQCGPVTAWLGSSSAEKDLRSGWRQTECHSTLVVMKDNLIHGCINHTIASRLREVIIPLCWALLILHLEHSFHF